MSIETTNEELGNKLFCDLKNDAEKANFFLSGRGYETGVVAKAIQNDVAMTYHRCAVATAELRRLHEEIFALRAALAAVRFQCEADSKAGEWTTPISRVLDAIEKAEGKV